MTQETTKTKTGRSNTVCKVITTTSIAFVCMSLEYHMLDTAADALWEYPVRQAHVESYQEQVLQPPGILRSNCVGRNVNMEYHLNPENHEALNALRDRCNKHPYFGLEWSRDVPVPEQVADTFHPYGCGGGSRRVRVWRERGD